MRVGCRLRWVGSGRTKWTDIRTVIGQSGPDSAIARSVRGSDWTDSDHLLADVVNLLALANWQRQGKKAAPKPKPIQRPGVEANIERIGADPIPVGDFNAWWNKK